MSDKEYAVDLRDQYERRYEDYVINDDVLATLIHEFEHTLSAKGIDPATVVEEARKLARTLEFSSYYNLVERGI